MVEECRQRLLSNGFSELKEKEPWNVKPLGKVSLVMHVHTRVCSYVQHGISRSRAFFFAGLEDMYVFCIEWLHVTSLEICVIDYD